MATCRTIPESNEYVHKTLSRVFQSANLNFLFGSGASVPAIAVAGNVEQEIADHYAAGESAEANQKMLGFLNAVQVPTNSLISGAEDPDIDSTIENYVSYLKIVEKILLARRSSILPTQTNIFTTNYDLFFEKASESCATLRLNDGFSRLPNIGNTSKFESNTFFDEVTNSSNVYGYRVELPRANLIKLHGSLSWAKEDDELAYRVAERTPLEGADDLDAFTEYVSNYCLVLPRQAKFEETLMDRVYYDLLRIYSNELDKENSVLVVFGFSFADAHILDITKRALRNPTLKVFIFAYSQDGVDAMANTFSRNNNVEIVGPADAANIDFATFNEALDMVVPTWEGA